MPILPIKWSERDQKYWIYDVDGDVLWFGSSLDAKAVALEVALKQAALDEREAIVAWLRLNVTPHNDIDEWADEIEAGVHHREK